MTLRDILNTLEHHRGLVQTLGISFEVIDAQVTAQMTIDERHVGAPGVSHGGAVMALLDSALGASAMMHSLARGQATSTVELKVNFLRPSRLGQTLVTSTEVQSLGRSLLVLSGAACDAETGEQVAFAVGTFNLYPLRRGEGSDAALDGDVVVA